MNGGSKMQMVAIGKHEVQETAFSGHENAVFSYGKRFFYVKTA